MKIMDITMLSKMSDFSSRLYSHAEAIIANKTKAMITKIIFEPHMLHLCCAVTRYYQYLLQPH